MSPVKTLDHSVRSLFYIGLLGQFAFAIYIILLYGESAVKGDWNTWTEAMIHGIIEGDILGNLLIVMHIFLALVITVCGPLQFFKVIRTRWPNLHKWNGRIYIMTALIISSAAIFMVWNRPATIGGELGRIATSGNGVLIILFSIFTIRTAMQRNFTSHRKWAIRTFIVVSGVWFFRIGFGTWLLITGFKAPGVTNDLTGWFDQFLYFGSYLVPLGIAELYISIKAGDSKVAKKWLSVGLIVLCLLLLGGTAVTAKVFWLDSI